MGNISRGGAIRGAFTDTVASVGLPVDAELAALLTAAPCGPVLAGPGDLAVMRSRDRVLVPDRGVVEREWRVSVDDVDLGGVPALRIAPRLRDPHGAVLSVHGGGLVSGSCASAIGWHARLASARGVEVFVPEYRLVPEHSYPAPLDDVDRAWLALVEDRRRAGSSSPTILMGASSGGGLAAGLVNRILGRERPEIPDAVLLLQPQLDDRDRTDAPCDYTDTPFWDRTANRLSWSWYLAETAVPPAEAAQARATDLTGWPPTFIEIAQCDLFRDEGIEFVNRLSAHGVSVEAHLWAGAFHGFDDATSTRCARRAVEARLAYLETILNRRPTTDDRRPTTDDRRPTTVTPAGP